ncbi:hypothetical protein Pan241w_37750 [Gimesia alba]|uniref:Lincosamide resistance protein n=1 Tax=Gimesia alba TaxID=2527973 RepID=A0A517RII9_9PLAN|nr:hypothetical protein [Gimesia alba]QDT43673.1 hypothetical protein Pan241w_37750 [Gimesia alba]
MPPPIHHWQSLPIPEIQSSLDGFTNWVLCGGRSIDWILRRTTRDHNDTDIGIFRSDIITCLNSFDPQRVYLCDPPGELITWDGEPIPECVHDIWITTKDEKQWSIQIMIYDDTVDSVIYRRDTRITWPKRKHTISIRGIKVLNPIITLLFKLHRHELQDKDCHDVSTLINSFANNRIYPDL